MAVTAAEKSMMLFDEQVAAGELVITLDEEDRDALNRVLNAIKRGQTILGMQLGPWPSETRDQPPPIAG